MSRRGTGTLLLGLWLVVVWTFLWGAPSPANVLTGVVVAVLVHWFLPSVDQGAPRLALRPLHLVAYLLWFLKELVIASVRVAWLVIAPRRLEALHPAIIAVPVRRASDQLLVLVANSITLTPGTLTVEIATEPPALYVHVLEPDDPEALRRSILDLERRVITAFGNERARAALDDATIPDVAEVVR